MLHKNKFKIAFCFSWQARTLDQTYKFFRENLFDAAKEQWFDYDVFCAVEDDSDAEKINLLDPTKVEKIKSSNVEKIIENKYWDFKWFHKNHCILYCYSSALLKKSFYNYLQQYYKVKRSIELKREYEKKNNCTYDVVLRLRFDYVLLNKLDFHKILKDLEWTNIICQSLTNRKLTLSPISDFFFMGNSTTMDIAWKHFDNFMESFIWHDVPLLFKPILYDFRLIDMINYKLNNFFLTNYLVRLLWIINTKCFFHSYCAERILYDYLVYNDIKVITDTFSFHILRRNWNNMDFIFKKCIYEKTI